MAPVTTPAPTAAAHRARPRSVGRAGCGPRVRWACWLAGTVRVLDPCSDPAPMHRRGRRAIAARHASSPLLPRCRTVGAARCVRACATVASAATRTRRRALVVDATAADARPPRTRVPGTMGSPLGIFLFVPNLIGAAVSSDRRPPRAACRIAVWLTGRPCARPARTLPQVTCASRLPLLRSTTCVISLLSAARSTCSAASSTHWTATLRVGSIKVRPGERCGGPQYRRSDAAAARRLGRHKVRCRTGHGHGSVRAGIRRHGDMACRRARHLRPCSCATACLFLGLGVIYRDYLIVFQFLLALDVGSHWIHMYR